MSTESGFRIFKLCCLLLARVSLASEVCTTPGNVDQDLSEEMEGINVNLMQQSLMMKAGHTESVASHSLPLSHIPKIDSHMPEEALLAELRLAKQVRQQWDKHVASLEELLATPRARVPDTQHGSKKVELLSHGVSQSQPGDWERSWGEEGHEIAMTVLDQVDIYWMQIALLSVVFGVAAGYAINAVIKHEKERSLHLIPWYHDSLVLWKVLIAVSILWYVVGLIASTKIFLYTDGGIGERHLTMIESMYMSVQVMTTIGYGDLTPIHFWGKMFKVLYGMTGVMLIGVMVVDGLENYLQSKQGPINKLLPRHPHLAVWMPAILLIAAGTILFACIPGETKIQTYGDAFYMSVITLLTIGFGDMTPTTPIGQLLSIIWMLLGVACLGCLIADVSSTIFADRVKFRSKISALKYFNEEKGADNVIDRIEFLRFELVRNGFDKGEFDKTYALFDEVDTAKNGVLDFQEFKAYVDLVCA